MDDIEPGDTIVVWKLDRLGRSTRHLFQILSELRERDIDFVSLPQGIDTTTAIGRMLYGQLAVFTEFQREQISDRTKVGMAAAKKRGVQGGGREKTANGRFEPESTALRKRGISILE